MVCISILLSISEHKISASLSLINLSLFTLKIIRISIYFDTWNHYFNQKITYNKCLMFGNKKINNIETKMMLEI